MRSSTQSRTLNVLLTDLVGSTSLMAQLGETAYEQVRRAHFRSLRNAISAHHGQEVKSTGDGILAVFESAVETVQCAVTIQQATDWQNRSGSGSLGLRIALSLGEVTLEDGDVYGTPVVEAARLVAAGPGGHIVATALVRAVAEGRAGVEFSDLEPLLLRGFPQPVAVCEIAWERRTEAPLPPALVDLPSFAFVGRGPELQSLRAVWERSKSGRCRAVMLAGEPGVGKTRLATELGRAVHDEGAMVLAGRCDEGLGVPYQPFVEALRHFVTHTPGVHLGAHLGRLAGELARLAPEIADIAPDLPAPLRSDPETERYRLFDAVAAWLAGLSQRGPTLLILDDLHWAARPTLLLMRHVVCSAEPMRLLVLGTYRDTELDRSHPLNELLADLRRQDTVERLTLAGLDADGVAAFATAVGHELAEEVVQAIHAETQGNPFFVGEVLQHLAETNAAVFDQLKEHLKTRFPIETLGIPEGVREVIGRRLSRLSEATEHVLSLASVQGEEFEQAVVAMAGDLAEETLVAALEEAEVARLIRGAWPSPRFRFTHALVRMTLYEELSVSRRRTLHRKVAEAIERLHPLHLDDQAPALSQHFALACAGGDTAPAVRYAARAGDRALAQLAHDEAVAFYTQALELLDSSAAPTDDHVRCELLISLGEAQRRAGDRAHRATLLRAAALAAELDDADRLTRAALANHRGFFSLLNEVDTERVRVLEDALLALEPGDSTARARLLVSLASELVFDTSQERRLQLAAEGLNMARRVGDLPTLGDVLVRGYIPIFTALDIDALRAHTRELGVVAEQLQDPALAFWAKTWGFMTAMVVGDLVGAGSLIAASARMADDVGQPFLRFIATFGRSHLARIHGQLAEAEKLAYDALALAESAGLPDSFGFFGIQLFWIRYDQGRLEETLDLFGKVMQGRRRSPLPLAAYCLTLCEVGQTYEARAIFQEFAAAGFALPFAWMFGATILAEAAFLLGEVEGARVLYDGLAPHHALLATNGAATTGPIAHYLGLLATTLGRADDAIAHFEAARELELRIHAPVWLARTDLEYADALRRRGDADDLRRAAELTTETSAVASELGLTAIARRGIDLFGRPAERSPYE